MTFDHTSSFIMTARLRMLNLWRKFRMLMTSSWDCAEL